jgi:hypothetical protein
MADGGGDEKASGSTPPVFTGYASRDAAAAAALVESLERHGIACWIAPRDVKAGVAIRRCDCSGDQRCQGFRTGAVRSSYFAGGS